MDLNTLICPSSDTRISRRHFGLASIPLERHAIRPEIRAKPAKLPAEYLPISRAETARREIGVTHNSKHFEPLYQKWWEAGKHHSGIIISKKIGLGELLRRVLRLLNRITADEMEDNFVNLSEFAERRARQ